MIPAVPSFRDTDQSNQAAVRTNVSASTIPANTPGQQLVPRTATLIRGKMPAINATFANAYEGLDLKGAWGDICCGSCSLLVLVLMQFALPHQHWQRQFRCWHCYFCCF